MTVISAIFAFGITITTITLILCPTKRVRQEIEFNRIHKLPACEEGAACKIHSFG